MTMGGNYDPMAQLRAEIAQTRRDLKQALDHYAGGIRREVAERLAASDKQLANLAEIAKVMKIEQGGGYDGGTVRIENIAGKRIPYTLLMDIPIQANQVGVVQQSVSISQEGPFVAVRRMATFQSNFEYQVTDPETGAQPRFVGRSFGRYRPIHSAWDIHDGHGDAIATTPNPFALGSSVGVAGLTSSISSFRSMEFDARIEVEDTGSGLPRQNQQVPSSLWTPQINAPFDLAALDFFERNSVITVKITPNHINNPPAGNADGATIFTGAAGWPFADGQYDPHEGIVTPAAFVAAGDGVFTSRLATDPIQRLPNGVLTIGWEGYRIYQQTAPIR